MMQWSWRICGIHEVFHFVVQSFFGWFSFTNSFSRSTLRDCFVVRDHTGSTQSNRSPCLWGSHTPVATWEGTSVSTLSIVFGQSSPSLISFDLRYWKESALRKEGGSWLAWVSPNPGAFEFECLLKQKYQEKGIQWNGKRQLLWTVLDWLTRKGRRQLISRPWWPFSLSFCEPNNVSLITGSWKSGCPLPVKIFILIMGHVTKDPC